MTIELTPEGLAARYRLLCRSTQVEAVTYPQTEQITVHLQALHKLLKHDLLALARRGSPNDFADIYFELQQELERFEEFCSFPALSQKVVVAFGGSFSAGKSSLINALLGRRLLVTEVDPTTSLLTYLLKGEQDAVHAHNLFGHRIELSNEEFLSLTHDEVERYGSNISRLLRTAFITLADFPWPNIALIDTPGYTKPEDQVQTSRTDEHIARIQLNAAQAIVWVIDVRQGCITENDLKFLATLQPNIPRLIVVGRADQKPTEDVLSIVSGIKKTLSERNLPFVDVIPVSTRKQNEWPVKPILKQLDVWSQMNRDLRFAHNFKSQFTRYARFIEEGQRQVQFHINRLNRILVMTDSPEAQADAEELKKNAENALASAKEHAKELGGLRHQFFSRLKAIGDAVSIPLPEPSEIDLLDSDCVDLQKLLIEQREQQGLSGPDEPEALRDLMKEYKSSRPSLFGIKKIPTLKMHSAAALDAHTRETYVQLIAALILAAGPVGKNQSELFKKLLTSLQLEDIRASLYSRASNLDVRELQECRRILREYWLAKSCLLDALILCRQNQPFDDSTVRLFSEMALFLGIQLIELAELSLLTGFILGFYKKVSYDNGDILLYSAWFRYIEGVHIDAHLWNEWSKIGPIQGSYVWDNGSDRTINLLATSFRSDFSFSIEKIRFIPDLLADTPKRLEDLGMKNKDVTGPELSEEEILNRAKEWEDIYLSMINPGPEPSIKEILNRSKEWEDTYIRSSFKNTIPSLNDKTIPIDKELRLTLRKILNDQRDEYLKKK